MAKGVAKIMEGPYVIRKGGSDWIPMGDGVQLSYLRKSRDEYSILLKMESGGRFPMHKHVGGEEVYVIEGSVQLGKVRLEQGDYYYAPPGVSETATTDDGCTLLITSARGLEVNNPTAKVTAH
jgi:anti-sigma factor ChrR (cupin superfamily)